MFAMWCVTEHKNSHSKDKRKTRTRNQRERSSLADDVAFLKTSLASKAQFAYGNKTGNLRENRTHQRAKRFISYPRFVEVMVVADYKMVLYHGANLQHYILTLMSIVSTFKRRYILRALNVPWGNGFNKFRQVAEENLRFLGGCHYIMTIIIISVECLFCVRQCAL